MLSRCASTASSTSTGSSGPPPACNSTTTSTRARPPPRPWRRRRSGEVVCVSEGVDRLRAQRGDSIRRVARSRAALRIEFLRWARSLHPLSARTRSRAARPLPAGRDPPRSPRSNAVREGASLLQQRRGLGVLLGRTQGENPRGGCDGGRNAKGTEVGDPAVRCCSLICRCPPSADQAVFPLLSSHANSTRFAERNRAKINRAVFSR